MAADQGPETLFDVGDIVWAKMKGFPYWPARIVEAPENVKRPVTMKKKPAYCVFFFGQNNYAWLLEDCVKDYEEHKSSMDVKKSTLKEAVSEAEDYIAAHPQEKTRRIREQVEAMYNFCDDESLKGSPSLAAIKREVKEDTSSSKKVKKRQASVDSSSSAGSATKAKKRKKTSLECIPSTSSGPTNSSTTSNAATINKSNSTGGPVYAMPNKPAGPIPSYFTSTATVHPTTRDGAPTSATSSKSPVEDTIPTYTLPTVKHVKPLARACELSGLGPGQMKVGFLGLGTMGSGMAAILVRTGFDVMVWNRTESKCHSLQQLGAMRGATPAEVVAACDVTFACVSDPQAVRDVVFGNCGVLESVGPSKAFVDMSTVDDGTSDFIGMKVKEKGGRFLAAPVSGSKAAAEGGTLILCCAGDRSLYEDCEQCFNMIGKRHIYLGTEVGQASRMKLICNMMVGTFMASMAEAMSLAEKAGLSHTDVLEMMDLGALSCPLIRTKGKAISEATFPVSFLLKHQQKDLRLCIQMGDQLEHQLPLAASANEMYKRARALGYSDFDMAAIYKAAYL